MRLKNIQEKNYDMIKKTVIDFDWEKWITSHLILEHIELCGRITFLFFVNIFHCRKKLPDFSPGPTLGMWKREKCWVRGLKSYLTFGITAPVVSLAISACVRPCDLCAMRKSNWFSSFLLSFLMKYMTSFDGFSTFITALLISLKLASRTGVTVNGFETVIISFSETEISARINPKLYKDSFECSFTVIFIYLTECWIA